MYPDLLRLYARIATWGFDIVHVAICHSLRRAEIKVRKNEMKLRKKESEVRKIFFAPPWRIFGFYGGIFNFLGGCGLSGCEWLSVAGGRLAVG